MPDLNLSVAYHELHAVHDQMSKTLRVDGSVTVEGGGVAVSIFPADIGFNPQMFMLTIQFTVTGESPSNQPLHYEQPWSEDGVQYTEVGFVAKGPSAPVPDPLPIEVVH